LARALLRGLIVGRKIDLHLTNLKRGTHYLHKAIFPVDPYDLVAVIVLCHVFTFLSFFPLYKKRGLPPCFSFVLLRFAAPYPGLIPRFK
jgi:hypothetical protein